jgi:hypothetical protein
LSSGARRGEKQAWQDLSRCLSLIAPLRLNLRMESMDAYTLLMSSRWTSLESLGLTTSHPIVGGPENPDFLDIAHELDVPVLQRLQLEFTARWSEVFVQILERIKAPILTSAQLGYVSPTNQQGEVLPLPDIAVEFPSLQDLTIGDRVGRGSATGLRIISGWKLPELKHLDIADMDAHSDPMAWRAWAVDFEPFLSQLQELTINFFATKSHFRLFAWSMVGLERINLLLGDYSTGIREVFNIIGADQKGESTFPNLKHVKTCWQIKSLNMREAKYRFDALVRLATSRKGVDRKLKSLTVIQSDSFSEERQQILRELVGSLVIEDFQKYESYGRGSSVPNLLAL